MVEDDKRLAPVASILPFRLTTSGDPRSSLEQLLDCAARGMIAPGALSLAEIKQISQAVSLLLVRRKYAAAKRSQASLGTSNPCQVLPFPAGVKVER